MMITEMRLGDVEVEVVRKDIKNVHLSVNPPTGKVRISAPESMNLDLIRAYALTKLAWIREQQARIRNQERELPKEFVERESHYVWGKRYLLTILESEERQKVELTHTMLAVQVRPGTGSEKIGELVDEWYRGLLREAAQPLIQKWEGILGVKTQALFIQQMKTRWGGCSHETGTIRLNTELAKRAPEFLDYVVLHEMVHLLEPNHGERFQSLMDRHLPNWRHIRDELNRLPVPYGEWN
jgi:predicted metal-dependent hydrolase